MARLLATDLEAVEEQHMDTVQEAMERPIGRRDHIHQDTTLRPSNRMRLAVARYQHQAHRVEGRRGKGIKLRKRCRIRD